MVNGTSFAKNKHHDPKLNNYLNNFINLGEIVCDCSIVFKCNITRASLIKGFSMQVWCQKIHNKTRARLINSAAGIGLD